MRILCSCHYRYTGLLASHCYRHRAAQATGRCPVFTLMHVEESPPTPLTARVLSVAADKDGDIDECLGGTSFITSGARSEAIVGMVGRKPLQLCLGIRMWSRHLALKSSWPPASQHVSWLWSLGLHGKQSTRIHPFRGRFHALPDKHSEVIKVLLRNDLRLYLACQKFQCGRFECLQPNAGGIHLSPRSCRC